MAGIEQLQFPVAISCDGCKEQLLFPVALSCDGWNRTTAISSSSFL
jgi:hypothetical protein